MSYEDEKEEFSLAPQLGTDPLLLAQAINDMRRLSVFEQKRVKAILYGLERAQTSKAWARLMDNYLSVAVSVGGRGRRDMIRMEDVRHGGAANVGEEINRPSSWIARNITNRNWEEKEKERLGID